MTDSVRRVYWDTGLFICFLNLDEKEKREISEDNLKHARDGKIVIYTSMWTIVEVIKPKGVPTPLTEEQASRIKRMFQWPWLKKIQVHEGVAFKAAELARLHGLKPADAIHGATAIMEKVDALQAWDRDFSKLSALVTIEEPRRLTAQQILIDVATPIGPKPDEPATQPDSSDASTEPPPPSSQSGDDEQE